MAAAKALGARRIIGVDIVDSRLEFAKSYAATDVFKPSARGENEGALEYAARNAKDMQDQLGIATEGLEALDLVVECSGAAVRLTFEPDKQGRLRGFAAVYGSGDLCFAPWWNLCPGWLWSGFDRGSNYGDCAQVS